MNINILLFKDIVIFSELFLGISIIYLVIHCTFLAVQKKYPLIQNSVIYLSVLSLLFSVYLILNEHLTVLEVSSLNNTFLLDYTGFFSKIIISLSRFELLTLRLSGVCSNQLSYKLVKKSYNLSDQHIFILS